MKKTLLVSLTFGLLLSGCNDEDSLGTSEGTGVRFTSYMVESRATDTAWEAGDEIGVYMQADAASGYQKINVKYANSNGDVNTFTSESPIEYSGNESTVNFMAVYPFSSLVTDGTYEFTLGNEELAENDIMYASATSVAAGTQNVTLNFQHKLTKIVLQLNDEDGTPVTGATVSIDKQRVNGTLDVATGTITATDDYTSTLQFAGSNGTYEAIVIPDEGREGRSVLIEVDEKKYSYPVGDIEFSEAQKYTFPVSLRPVESGGEEGGGTIIELKAGKFNIDDWTEGKTIGWIISSEAEISTVNKVQTVLMSNQTLAANGPVNITPTSGMTLADNDVYCIKYTQTNPDLPAGTLIISQPNATQSRAAQRTYTLPAGMETGRLLFAVGEFTNGFSVSSTVALTLDTVSVYSESVPEEDEPETPSDTEEEITVWEGSHDFGNWTSLSIEYTSDLLAQTTEDCTLRFYYTNRTEGAQLQFAGLTSIDVTDDTGYVDMEVSAELIAALTEAQNGWTFANGQNLTVTRIALIPASGSSSDTPGEETPSQTEEIEVWTGSHNLGSWNGTSINYSNTDILAKTTVGSTLRFYYTDWTEGAQIQFAGLNTIDVTDNTGYVDMEVTAELVTTIAENQWPYLNGQNITVTRIILICPTGN